jgi:predicted lipid-binding transport protein (Tim44 family)
VKSPATRAVAAGIALAVAGRAWSRAGGGAHGGASHSASIGHPGSSNHSSSGGGGGISLGAVIGLLLLGLVIWLLYRRLTRGGSLSSRTQNSALGAAIAGALASGVGARSASATARPSLPAAIDTIRAQDPDFELESFLQRAEMTFFLVKRGLQQNDASAIRPYVDDSVFAAVSKNIGLMKASHRHTLLESLNVRALHLTEAGCDASQQRIQVHFDLVYRAKTLDDANHVLADEGDDNRHGERWMFVRAATAKTSKVGDVTAARCPACGAELRLSLAGLCSHCRASVTNGSVDWVVADVQPAAFMGYPDDSLYARAAPTFMEGVATLCAADPQFSFDAFRARVQTCFIALQDAWCRQNLEAGRAFLSPGAYFSWRAQLETMAAQGRRNVMENLQVQKIEPIRVVHGHVFDDLTVRITASSTDYEVDKDAHIVFGDRSVHAFSEDWTFQRSVGVATSNKPGTLESTCPSCGAPVALTQIGECRYCKAAVTSGKFDWVVSRIEQEDAAGSIDSGSGNIGEQLALQVGAAVVGGLLGSLLSGGSRHDDD